MVMRILHYRMRFADTRRGARACRAACHNIDRRRVRYAVAAQHSLQCFILAQPVDIVQPAPATELL